MCSRPSARLNPNNTQSDETDNFSGTQELQGTNDVGSGNGQSELCGSNPSAPAGTTVDYSRSSKPVSTSTCPTGVELGFAKDAVVGVDFQTINPALYGTPNGYLSQTDPQCSSSGAGLLPELRRVERNGELHQVPRGWNRPGGRWLAADSTRTNCGTGGGPACSGTPFTNISNTGINGGNGATSVAYRLFCQHGPSATPDTSQITDWGQLTNLGGQRGR